MHQLGCSCRSFNLTTDVSWKASEKPTLEANAVRELAATAIKRFVSLLPARRAGRLRVTKKLRERTAKEVAAKDPGFMKEKGGRLKLTGAGQYEALPCVSNTTNTTSKALSTGGGFMF
jgi:hypothetical protein